MDEIKILLGKINKNGYYTLKSPILYECLKRGYIKEIRSNIYKVTDSGSDYLILNDRLMINDSRDATPAHIKKRVVEIVKSKIVYDIIIGLFILISGTVILYLIGVLH